MGSGGWIRGGFLAVVAAAGVDAAYAQEKSRYWLFNPTPVAQLREMTTDRPDTTEVPFTIDAGHVQVESSVFAYTRSFRDPAGEITHGRELAYANFRVGLTNDLELSVVTRPYGMLRTRAADGSLTSRSSGAGGTDIRFKYNIWGNDTYNGVGSTAFALLPYITVPSDRSNGISSDKLEGGLNAFYSIKLSEKFNLGINTGIGAIRNADATGYTTEWLFTASLGQEITEKFGIYYEFISRVGFNDHLGEALLAGSGITYRFNKNLQLDAGINFGLTHTADRFNPWVGFSARY